jgi:hypothetical protein
MFISVPAIIAAFLSTVAMGRTIGGIAAYASARDFKTVAGDHRKIKGGIRLIDMTDILPWSVVMISVAIVGAVTLSLLCKHKSGGWYHQRKEEKRPCCALGQARDPVIQGDPGANKMLQRIEDHCNVHHKLHELGMHQLDAPKVTPKEPAVKFYNHNRQQQCNSRWLRRFSGFSSICPSSRTR